MVDSSDLVACFDEVDEGVLAQMGAVRQSALTVGGCIGGKAKVRDAIFRLDSLLSGLADRSAAYSSGWDRNIRKLQEIAGRRGQRGLEATTNTEALQEFDEVLDELQNSVKEPLLREYTQRCQGFF